VQVPVRCPLVPAKMPGDLPVGQARQQQSMQRPLDLVRAGTNQVRPITGDNQRHRARPIHLDRADNASSSTQSCTTSQHSRSTGSLRIGRIASG
jgi:hypothetical protein